MQKLLVFHHKGLNQEVGFPAETWLHPANGWQKKDLEASSLLGKHKLQIESRIY